MWPGLTRTRITSRAARAAPEPAQVPDISVYTHAAILAADAAVEHSPAQGKPHDQCGCRPAERPWPDGAAGLIRRRRHEECSIVHCRTRSGRLGGWRRRRCSYTRRREIRFEPAHVLLELFHLRRAFDQAPLQRQLRRQVCGLDPTFRAVRKTHMSLPAALAFQKLYAITAAQRRDSLSRASRNAAHGHDELLDDIECFRVDCRCHARAHEQA